LRLGLSEPTRVGNGDKVSLSDGRSITWEYLQSVRPG